MAGVGFVLRRLAERDDLGSRFGAWSAAAAITSGPWLMTVLAILGSEHWGRLHLAPWAHESFRVVLSWNFCLSIVLAAPFALLATRLAADDLYLRRPGLLSGGFVALTRLALLAALPVALLLWGFLTDLPLETRIVAIANFMALTALWMVLGYLSVLRDHVLVLSSFLAGTATATVLAALAGAAGGATMLIGAFTIGLTITLMLAAMRLLHEFPAQTRDWAELRASIRPYRVLALVGLLGAAAPWMDKWVHWAGPLAELTTPGLPNRPAYDSAMFVASLALVPGMALFFVKLETELFRAWRSFFDSLLTGASLAELDGLRRNLAEVVARGALSLLLLQALVAALGVLAAPLLVSAGILTQAQAPIFRLGVMAAPFHTLFLAAMVVLAYLDARRDQLWAVTVFLLLNGGLTTASLAFGFEASGWSYLLAAMIAAGFATALLGRALHRLLYLVFIVHNPAVRPHS